MYGLQQGFINFICIKSLETCRTREPMINRPQQYNYSTLLFPWQFPYSVLWKIERDL